MRFDFWLARIYPKHLGRGGLQPYSPVRIRGCRCLFDVLRYRHPQIFQTAHLTIPWSTIRLAPSVCRAAQLVRMLSSYFRFTGCWRRMAQVTVLRREGFRSRYLSASGHRVGRVALLGDRLAVAYLPLFRVQPQSWLTFHADPAAEQTGWSEPGLRFARKLIEKLRRHLLSPGRSSGSLCLTFQIVRHLVFEPAE